MSFIPDLSILILHKLLTLLVDGVVGEMRILVRLNVHWVVFFTREPNQALVEDVDAPWVHACHQHVESNVKFEAI
jgi:hypothetical protein